MHNLRGWRHGGQQQNQYSSIWISWEVISFHALGLHIGFIMEGPLTRLLILKMLCSKARVGKMELLLIEVWVEILKLNEVAWDSIHILGVMSEWKSLSCVWYCRELARESPPPWQGHVGQIWWTRWARTLGVPLWACLRAYPKTWACLFYCFMTFTNSSDSHKGLSPTTLICKKSNLEL